MNRFISAVLWVFPLLVIFATACGPLFGDCGHLEPTPFESGTYVTTGEPNVTNASSVHAGGGPKTLTLDTEERRVTIEYTDAEGREIVEEWSILQP